MSGDLVDDVRWSMIGGWWCKVESDWFTVMRGGV